MKFVEKLFGTHSERELKRIPELAFAVSITMGTSENSLIC